MLLKTWVSLLKKVFLWFFMLALWCIKDKYYINRWLFLCVILVPRWLHYFIWFANPNLLTWYSKQYNLWITSPPHVFLTWYLLLKSTNAEHLGTRKKQISQDYSTWCWIHHGQEEEERGKWKIWKTDGLKLYNSSSWQYRCVAWNTSLSFLLFIISCRKKKMCSFRWLYSAGQSWRCLDETAQGQIERLWRCNQANWITSESFPGPVFVDTAQMVLIHKGAFYAIARSIA